MTASFRLSPAGTVPGGEWEIWFDKLREIAALADGWNGDRAVAPAGAAVRSAESFLRRLAVHARVPQRLAPSAVGGVGVTFRTGDRKVYVEFYNDGSAHALFSCGDADGDMRTAPVETTADGFDRVIREAESYLYA